MQSTEEEETMVVGRKSRKKKKTAKWNKLYFQQTKVLEAKQLTGPKKRPIRMGHRLFKELSCAKCDKTFHKRISLALHNAEFHKTDIQRKKNSKSRNREVVDDIHSLTGNSSSSEEFSDAELSKQFKDDVKDDTEDELVSSDDEFNEAWEKENLPEQRQRCRGPTSSKHRGLKSLPESQTYRKGEWEWMLNHNLFLPTVVVEDSLNIAMRSAQQRSSSESENSLDLDDIESILGPDSDEEFTYNCEQKLNSSIGFTENQPNCDKFELCVSNDDDDEVVCIDLLSSDSEEESDEYLNTANNDESFHTEDEIQQLESDPKYNCNLVLKDFVTENLLHQLKTKYNFKFAFPDAISINDDKNLTQNGCESDSESSQDGSCIVLSSSSDDLDEDEVLSDDYDDYSDDDCYIIDEDCDTETILPLTLPILNNDIMEIDE